MFQIEMNSWQLAGFYPYIPNFRESVETGVLNQSVTGRIEARVPGSVQDDLFRAGMIEDPYRDQNSLACEWIENRWWVYQTEVTVPDSVSGRLELRFEGIDYRGHVLLNGEKLAEYEGMFTPCISDVTDRIKRGSPNVVTVILEHAPDEYGQAGYTCDTSTQKSRFNYKWDFCTRLVNLGLYRPVTLREHGVVKIVHTDFRTAGDPSNGRAVLGLEVECFGEHCAVEAEFVMRLAGNEVARCLKREELFSGSGSVECDITVPNAKVWNPNGRGAPNLYEISAEVRTEDDVSDRIVKEFGFRKIRMIQNEDAEDGSYPYTFEVNGEKLYAKGVNWVPLDQMYGRVTPERYRKAVEQMAAGNVNLVRVWGGGLIESETFYDLCDEFGILVWQEFVQTTSGIDGVPSRKPEYLQMLLETAVCQIKTKRSHACLAAWSGGNELSTAPAVPIGFDDVNIAMLRGCVQAFSPQIPMLPSSPSGPLFFGTPSGGRRNHDVHGYWNFLGPEEHYRHYNGLESQLHSEFGVNGMTCAENLPKFLSPEHLRVTDVGHDLVWRHHGEWWDSHARDASIFGEIDTLEECSELSQFIQWEGLRYVLESNRRRAFRNSGSIVWQFDEPFPNVYSTSLIDYYGTPRAGYFAMREAYEGMGVSAEYSKLVYAPGERAEVTLFALSERSGTATVNCRAVRISDSSGERSSEILDSTVCSVELRADRAERLGVLRLVMPESGAVGIEAEIEQDGRIAKKSFLLLVRDGSGICDRRPVLDFMKKLRRRTDEICRAL